MISSPAAVSRKRTAPRTLQTESVGRAGTLRLEYEQREGRTIVARSHCTTPWHLLPPIYLDETGAAYTLLVNPSGGLVGGDHLSIEMDVHDGAHVIISTPSANRVYRSQGERSEQEIKLTVGPGAVLEWFPEHTIPFAESRFRQKLHATLAPGATILLWDALASGRMANGERWAFADLENDIRITTASGGLLTERYLLDQKSGLGRVGLAEEWNYVASLYVINDAMSSEVWSRLESRAAAIVDERPGLVLGGVSTPAVPGLAIKLLAKTAPDLTYMLESVWAAVRDTLWNLPPVALRKY
ncbi:MAG: urease accessory protein UreD [Nitrospira sp.]|nr:urease accessory protein UreD [Nitrospira sp.]